MVSNKWGRTSRWARVLALVTVLTMIVIGVAIYGRYRTGWERNWLAGIPCRAPCWEGIEPGKTPIALAERLLQKHEQVGPLQYLPPYRSGYGTVYWSRWKDDEYSGGSVTYLTNTSTVVLIRVTFPNDFALGDVVQQYGEPTHVIALIGRDVERSDQIGYDFQVLWLSQGLRLTWASGYPGKKPTINENLRLQSVDFFEPTSAGLQHLMENWSPQQLKFMTTWKGYIDFDQYCQATQSMAPGSCDIVLATPFVRP